MRAIDAACYLRPYATQSAAAAAETDCRQMQAAVYRRTGLPLTPRRCTRCGHWHLYAPTPDLTGDPR